MNTKNLEYLKKEMATLGFGEKLSDEMEKQMETGVSEFNLKNQFNGLKGELDFTLYFKQSSQSDYYYLNSYEVTKPEKIRLEVGESFRVATNVETGTQVQNFDSAYQAVAYFKTLDHPSTLSVAKGNEIRPLVTVQEGQVVLLEKDFGKTFRSPEMPQTFYVDKGKGFTASQAINLLEGRSVFRDDLLNKDNQPYKAWMKLDLDGPRDKHFNFSMNQYHDPAYGFDLMAVVEKFSFKELNNPDQKAKLEASLRNGDSASVTVLKDGQEVKLKIEAVPRYLQVNLYDQHGKAEKREQFLKQELSGKDATKAKSKGKESAQTEGLAV